MSNFKGFFHSLHELCILAIEVGDGMTGKIPEQLIEQIRSQSDIVDVISDYMQLTKRGRNWFGLCPFHGEQTPSFSVSEDKQIFHCFGCGAGGNAITFVMDIENITFPEAVVKLGERVGIQLDVAENRNSDTLSPHSKSEERMKEAHAFAMDFYQHLLLNTEDGEEALNYLLQRGFSRELIESNGVGWSLPNWDTLTVLLERKGFSLEEIAESGLIIKRDGDSTFFDRFRGRIMFPIRDDHGKVIAFSGRILHSSEDEAKYVNSPESPIFHKSQVLYNLDRARSVIRKTRQVILMEGYIDVLAATQAGIQNAVASMGTSLTPQHIQKLKRLVEQITICYDGDNAGFEAAKRASEMLQHEGLKVTVAVLPDKLDPDEYIRSYGGRQFAEQILAKPYTFLSFMMLYARRNKNFQFESDTLQYIQEVLEHLVGKSSPIERDLYIRQLAAETNVSEEAIYAQFRKLEGENAKVTKRIDKTHTLQSLTLPASPNKPLTATDRAERLLLAHMLHNIDVVDKILHQGNEQIFVHDEYTAVFVRLIGFYEEFSQPDYQRFLELLEDSELRKLVMEAALTERDPDHAEEEINDSIRQLQRHRIETEINSKIHASKEAEKRFDYKLALELAQEVIQLKKTLTAM